MSDMKLNQNQSLSETVQKTEKELLQMLNANPMDAITNYECAWVYYSLGFMEKAAQHYDKAVQLGLDDGRLSEAFLKLACVYLRLSMHAEAKAVIEKAIGLFPEQRILKVLLAIALHLIGDYASSLAIMVTLVKTGDESVREYGKELDMVMASQV